MLGQTNFIAQFNAALRLEFGLTHGQFGGLYTLATLASASTLVFAGVLADRVGARLLATGAMLGLVVTTLLMASLSSLAVLVVALALPRLFWPGHALPYCDDDHVALVQPLSRRVSPRTHRTVRPMLRSASPPAGWRDIGESCDPPANSLGDPAGEA